MDYRDYVRPKFVELMQALGLECQFHRALGSKLFYRDKSGAEVTVINFLGGYIAALYCRCDPQVVYAFYCSLITTFEYIS